MLKFEIRAQGITMFTGCLVAWFCLIHGGAWAQDAVHFRKIVLTIPDVVAEVQSVDLDGDGRQDIVVQSTRSVVRWIGKIRIPDKERVLRIHLQTHSGNYPAEPQYQVVLCKDVFTWSLYEGEDDRDRGIYLYGPEGVERVRFGEDRKPLEPEPVVLTETLYKGRSTTVPAYHSFVTTDPQTGRALIQITQHDWLKLFAVSEEGDYRLLRKYALSALDRAQTQDFTGAGGNLRTTSIVPAVYQMDFDGDGILDLVAYYNYSLSLYSGVDQRVQPSKVHLLAGRKKSDRERVISFDSPPLFSDLNGDGLMDLVQVFPGRRGKGRAEIMIGDAEKGLRSAGSLKPGGFLYGAWFEDLNQDGYDDLILAGVPDQGIAQALDQVLNRRVNMFLYIYLNAAKMKDEKGVFSERIQHKEFRLPFSFRATSSEVSLEVLFHPNFEGDFNGDGKKDLLVKPDNREGVLEVYAGGRDPFFSKEPLLRIHAATSEKIETTHPRIVDLNGDGRSDLILLHKDVDRKMDQVEVLLSQ